MFIENLKENSFKMKFKLTWKFKSKFTNGPGRKIIQLQAAIFERIRNV